jgi:hypothetical protein
MRRKETKLGKTAPANSTIAAEISLPEEEVLLSPWICKTPYFYYQKNL